MPRTVPSVVEAGTMANAKQPNIAIGEDLLLRPWNEADAAVAIESFATPDIQLYHARRLDSEGEALEWIEYCAKGWREEKAASWAIVDVAADQILGRVTMYTNLERGVGEVAYWVLPAGRGRGFATRATVAVTAWAHDLGLHRVELEHSTENEGSRRVALGAGFVEEGVKRASGIHADGWHDMCLYSHLKSDS